MSDNDFHILPIDDDEDDYAGLGLATSYKMVESWGGSISVDSQIDRGTKFTIRLTKVSHG